MKIKIILSLIFSFCFTSCSNFHTNLSQYFSDFLNNNTKVINQQFSNIENIKEKMEAFSNLDFYFRIIQNQNTDDYQLAKESSEKEIIKIEDTITFNKRDKIELYKITDNLSNSIILNDDIISLSIFLDSSLIKKYENKEPVSFLDLMSEQTYTLVVTFNYASIIQEAKFYLYLKKK